MPMTKAQRRDYKRFLAGRSKVRKGWTEQGQKRRTFDDFLRKLMGWK